MSIIFSNLSSPLATLFCVGAVNLEAVKRLLKAFVGERAVFFIVAGRARVSILYNRLYTRSTEALSTAGDLVRLTQYVQAHRTLALEFLRSIHKLTVKTTAQTYIHLKFSNDLAHFVDN